MNEPKSYYVRSLDKEYFSGIRAIFYDLKLKGRVLTATNRGTGRKRTFYFLDDIPEKVEEIFNIETIDPELYVFRAAISLEDAHELNGLLIAKGRRIGK